MRSSFVLTEWKDLKQRRTDKTSKFERKGESKKEREREREREREGKSNKDRNKVVYTKWSFLIGQGTNCLETDQLTNISE